MANTKRSSRPRRHVTKKKHLSKKHTRKHLKKKQKSSGRRRSKRGGNSEDMKSAITNNDIDKVRYLIDQGEDVNQKITQFLIPKTLLTIAILNSSIKSTCDLRRTISCINSNTKNRGSYTNPPLLLLLVI